MFFPTGNILVSDWILYKHTYTRIHTHIYIYIYAYTYTYINIHTTIFTHTNIHTYIQVSNMFKIYRHIRSYTSISSERFFCCMIITTSSTNIFIYSELYFRIFWESKNMFQKNKIYWHHPIENITLKSSIILFTFQN